MGEISGARNYRSIVPPSCWLRRESPYGIFNPRSQTNRFRTQLQSARTRPISGWHCETTGYAGVSWRRGSRVPSGM